MNIEIRIDTTELLDDLEKIESGELKLPTVSAVRVLDEEFPIYIDDENEK